MKKRVPHVYTASGWFNDNDDKILTRMEDYIVLQGDKGLCTYHRPRKDGIELKPGEFHDPNVRTRVFMDNVVNIDKADIVYANLSTLSGPRLDTGTVWEVGYAITKGKLIVIVDDDVDYCNELFDRFKGLLNRDFVYVTKSLDSAESLLNDILSIPSDRAPWVNRGIDISRDDEDILNDYPVVIRPNEDEDIAMNIEDSVSEVYDKFTMINRVDAFSDMRPIVDNLSMYQYMIVDTTNRVSLYIFLMGVAYARGIPVISYSADDKNVNLMLVCSVLYHAVGPDNLTSLLKKVKKDGLDSVKFDHTNLRVY